MKASSAMSTFAMRQSHVRSAVGPPLGGLCSGSRLAVPSWAPRTMRRAGPSSPGERSPFETLAFAVGSGLAAVGRAASSVLAPPGSMPGDGLKSALKVGDSLDPGRSAVTLEYLTPGTTLLDLPLQHSAGTLQVTSHTASEKEAPPGTLPGSFQEWRVLAFTPDVGSTDLVQSVAKVCVQPSGDVCLRGEVLPLAYTKTLATITLAALDTIGAPVLPTGSAEGDKLHILCIGLGAGSVPSFFVHHVPHCEVDVVELEPSVLKAAVEGMGFKRCPRLRAHVEDGVLFALRAAGVDVAEGPGKLQSSEGVYDAVLVDAYDAGGGVPSELWSEGGGLCRALAAGLLRREAGMVAVNFLPHVDLGPPLAAYLSALGEGTGFSVQAKGSGNRIAVHIRGGAAPAGGVPAAGDPGSLSQRLAFSAAKIDKAIGCNFDMVELATRGFQQWPEPKRVDAGATPAEGPTASRSI